MRSQTGGAIGSTCVAYPTGLVPNEAVDVWVPLSNALNFSKEFDFNRSAKAQGSENASLLRLRVLVKYVHAK